MTDLLPLVSTITIDAAAVEQARVLHIQGQYREAWEVLSATGDDSDSRDYKISRHLIGNELAVGTCQIKLANPANARGKLKFLTRYRLKTPMVLLSICVLLLSGCGQGISLEPIDDHFLGRAVRQHFGTQQLHVGLQSAVIERYPPGTPIGDVVSGLNSIDAACKQKDPSSYECVYHTYWHNVGHYLFFSTKLNKRNLFFYITLKQKEGTLSSVHVQSKEIIEGLR